MDWIRRAAERSVNQHLRSASYIIFVTLGARLPVTNLSPGLTHELL